MLPVVSPAITELTKQGVEIASNGHLFGLVRVHHWCGNDPVREDVARVDLTDALQYLRVGQSDVPGPPADVPMGAGRGRFTESGWNVSDYMQFLGWQRLKYSVR